MTNSSIDSRAVPDKDIPGLSYYVEVFPDYDSSPDDADCYTLMQRVAFKSGEWSYVGVVVTPVIDGDAIEMCSDSLWGLEYGHYLCTDEDDNEKSWLWIDLDAMINGQGEAYDAYPVPDMIEEVRSQLAGQLGPKLASLQRIVASLAARDSAYC
jgi:hypothetical protein